jgi:hypothetical protein
LGEYYNLKNIRDLLVEGFSEHDLRDTLCFYEPDFEPLHSQLSPRADKETIAQQIIEYAYRQLKVDSLLDWAQQKNPGRYERHRPYRQEASTQAAFSAFSPIDNNHLGHGITLGGLYRDIPLQLAAIDWAEYGPLVQVRSGWLFIAQWTESHAIAFFKIQVSYQGAGYIHLVDVAHPKHTIWLKTATGYYREQEFHWSSSATDLWEFTWKETRTRLVPMR